MARKATKAGGRDDSTRGQKLTRKKAAFLKAYRLVGIIGPAAEATGIARQTHYKWLETDPEYKAEFKTAHNDAMDSLEEEARRRAQAGVQRLKFHEGNLILIPDPQGRKDPADPSRPLMVPYVEHQYSDTLLIFLLKAGRPKKFRDNVKVEQTGNLNLTLKGANSPLPTQEEAIARFQELTAKLAAKGVKAPKK